MAKQVKGYQADDGSFFTTREECALYEARLTLAAALETESIDADIIIPIIEQHSDAFAGFINASIAYNRAVGGTSAPAPTDA